MYDRGKLCDILDDHSTDIDVRKLQSAMRSRYPNERGFRSYEGLRGPTKWHRIDHLLEILETHTSHVCAAIVDAMTEIRPEDQGLRNELNSVCSVPEVERYTDFALHISPDGLGRAVSEEGERKATISLDIPDDIGLTIDLIEHDKTSETLLKQFGRRLYQILFPASIDKHFNQTEAVARRDGRKIRIRLTIEPDGLAQLPWEFMYRGEESYFLATNPGTVLSHYLDLPLPQGYARGREAPLHMLTIISNPKDQAQLDLNRWEGIVRSALAKPLKDGLLTLKTVEQATFEKIRDALLESPPDIVQFVGHGVYDNGKGYLALVNDAGGTWVVDDEQFAAIFAGVQDRLGLVCLATCESAKSDSLKSFLGIAPRIVQRGAPAVVAMRYPVLVSTAEIFLENFYAALAARKPVDWAVQSARNAIAIKVGSGNREFATPVLFMRAKDGNIF